MPYTPYADAEYYHTVYEGNEIPEEKLNERLKAASRHIDSLTYNRIVGRGISNLTEFQQEVIREVCCRQAEFEHENADLLDTVLSSYSLNGVSMGFDGQSWNIYADKGIAMRKADYELLSQTGLTCRLAVGR